MAIRCQANRLPSSQTSTTLEVDGPPANLTCRRTLAGSATSSGIFVVLVMAVALDLPWPHNLQAAVRLAEHPHVAETIVNLIHNLSGVVNGSILLPPQVCSACMNRLPRQSIGIMGDPCPALSGRGIGTRSRGLTRTLWSRRESNPGLGWCTSAFVIPSTPVQPLVGGTGCTWPSVPRDLHLVRYLPPSL